jgi:hypothetical protein
MRQAIWAATVLLACPAWGVTVDLSIRTPQGDPLPEARVSLIELSDEADVCEVVDQTVADSQRQASLALEVSEVYLVAVELAGFIGTELGPFRVEDGTHLKSEAPERFMVLLHTACDICVDNPVVNSYLLAKRCGAE